MSLPTPHVPLSWGELLDKITILEIKLERIRDVAAQSHIAAELERLAVIGAEVFRRDGVAAQVARLRAVNEALWDIEDAIRCEEARGRFGSEFIALARSVYLQNDTRAAIKRELNRLLASEFVEEKSYWSAAPAQAAA